jgi:hypothetical protein
VAGLAAGFPPRLPAQAPGAAHAGRVSRGRQGGVVRVFADEGAELREPALEIAVEALLVCQLLFDALEAAL